MNSKIERIHYFHPKINLQFFERINEKKIAYWLGFLFADGFIKTNKGEPYRVGIDASIKDFWIIERFM